MGKRGHERNAPKLGSPGYYVCALSGVSGEMCDGFVRRSPVTTFIAR